MKAIFKRFSLRACVPEKATPGSGCLDVFSARCVTLEPGATRPIETDIGLKFSKTYVCRLYSRSGLSLKGVILGDGVIDSDFQGNICVIWTNLSQRLIEIETGNRIAQMILLREEEAEFVEVDELDQTERGVKRFWFYRQIKNV